MTGFDSKRKAASAKLNDDDDAQGYIAQYESALTIAYQSGYYDGKKAAQPAQEPVATGVVRKPSAFVDNKPLRYPVWLTPEADLFVKEKKK
jgi:hypothetical protein